MIWMLFKESEEAGTWRTRFILAQENSVAPSQHRVGVWSLTYQCLGLSR